MLVETGEKIFLLSLDTGKQSGNISIPERKQWAQNYILKKQKQ